MQGAEPEIRKEQRDVDDDGKPDRFITSVFESGELVRREVEADRDEDGESEYVYLRIYAGGKVVYFQSTDHRLKIGMRAYHVGGDPRVLEMDVGLDGHFEWVVIGKPNPEEAIVLYREASGAIRRATEEEQRRVRPIQRIIKDSEGD